VATRQQQFERIAMPHTRDLLRVARRWMPDPAEAEDLVQEAMLSAWRGFDRFQPDTNIRAWLFRILINQFHARARKGQVSTVPLGSHDVGVGRATTEVFDAIDDLPVEQREVVLLGIVEGFTCVEMATMLNTPMGTVMSRLSRARAALRSRLGPKCAAKEAS
jgi:RNA polymerase sigma-70 factor (ECF subfamily)